MDEEQKRENREVGNAWPTNAMEKSGFEAVRGARHDTGTLMMRPDSTHSLEAEP